MRHLLETKNISKSQLAKETGVFKPRIINYFNYEMAEAREKKIPYPTQLDIRCMFLYLGYDLTIQFNERPK